MRCRDTALGEPLAGTAPAARWWWLIEVPGPWGSRALEEARVPVIRHLVSSPDRRVLLVRRRGRHPAVDPSGPLRVWIAGAMPGDPPPRTTTVSDHAELLAWPVEGPPGARMHVDHAPVLAVCANAARDLCCGLDGRALVQALDDDRAWECSHLGGHRFAPTALLVGHGLVYGRLDVESARSLLDSGPTAQTASFLRGRSSLPTAAQAAEAHLLARGVSADLDALSVAESGDLTTVGFGAATVTLRLDQGTARPASCGADPEPVLTWRVLD